MITFKSFLSEARAAPLYHGTGFGSIADILRNGFAPKTTHSNKKLNLGGRASNRGDGGDILRQKGVSFSRSFKTARTFGKFVIEIDQQKLAHVYKIVPIQYFQTTIPISGIDRRPTRVPDRDGAENEYEEFVITKTNIPTKFITTVHFKVVSDDQLEMVQRLKSNFPHIQFKEMK